MQSSAIGGPVRDDVQSHSAPLADWHARYLDGGDERTKA